MGDRRDIADAAQVIEHGDGSRTLYWPQDGIRRRYSRQTIARMFLHAVERGQTNPLLERLTTAEERHEMYEALEQVGRLAILVADNQARDTN